MKKGDAMPGPVQAPQTRYIGLDTDFGYDALGGMGRLGRHSMEVLEPGTRQSDRIPGPPRTVGRWFAKLLDSLTPASWRAQGKFRRGLEDFSAQTGRILGHLRNAAAGAPDDPQRRADLGSALRELAGLRQAARPMTSRGTDYAELLQTRVRRNMAILREEDPQRAQELRQLQTSGLLDAVIADLDDGQADMAADLALIRDALHTGADDMAARVETRATDLGASPAAPVDDATPPTAPQPYRSRFSPAALRDFFLGRLTFREEARQALQERQATLARFTGEARDSLQAALESVDAVLQDRLAADADSFAHVQHQVDEKMRRAIHCALEDVCGLALRHLDTPESVGQERQDFRRIDAGFVRQELAALERGDRPAGDSAPTDTARPDADPFRQGIRQARRQIQDISRLYGQLTEGLGELAQRDSRCRACLLLHGLAETDLPPDMDDQEWGRACDTLIEALRSPGTDPWAVRDALAVIDRRTGDARMPEAVRQRFREGRAALLRHLEPATDRPVFQLAGTGQAESRLDALEQARALHQVVGHAGALLQRARLPQADSLISQGLQISRLALRLRTDSPRETEHRQQAITELRTSVARFMANLTLARMQTENPTVHSAQPEARGLDTSGAREGLDLIRQSVGRILDSLQDQEGGVVARAALQDGLRLLEKGRDAAVACGRLLDNVIHKETDVAEQLAVCLESGRDDAAAALHGLLEGSRWAKGKHGEAKAAIDAFLTALRPVQESRGQSQLLRFLANRLSGAFTPHDVYMGFDGSIHMLINTDRQGLGGSRKLQGTRWITLPPPDQLRPGVSTGVHRLDQLLDAGDNRTTFYPQLHQLLTRYFSGIPYDLSLPGDGQ